MFKNMKKISTKLIVSFALVAFVVSIPAFLASMLLKSTDTKYSNALVENGFVQGDIGQFNTYLNKGSAVVRDIATQTDLERLKTAQQELTDIQSKTNEALEKIRPNCETPEEAALLNIIDAKIAEYRIYRDQVIDLGLKMQNEEAMDVFYTSARPVLNEAMDAAQKLMNLNVGLGTQISDELTIQTNIAYFIVILVIVAAFAIAIIFAFYISGTISKPVKEIDHAMAALTNGNLDNVSVSHIARDELGTLSENMRKLTVRLQDIIHEVSEILGQMGKGNFQVVSEKHEIYVGSYQDILLAMQTIRSSLSDTLSQINHRMLCKLSKNIRYFKSKEGGIFRPLYF